MTLIVGCCSLCSNIATPGATWEQNINGTVHLQIDTVAEFLACSAEYLHNVKSVSYVGAFMDGAKHQIVYVHLQTVTRQYESYFSSNLAQCVSVLVTY